MPSKLEEITGIFCRERQRWDDVALCEIKHQREESALTPIVTIKGPAEEDALQPGLTYRFYGKWVDHERYGRQFFFQTFIRAQPHGQQGVIRWLQQAPHIGQATASALWNKFQSDAVRLLREEPEVVCAALGGAFNISRAREAAEWLKQEQALEAAGIDLIDLLAGRGFPRATAALAIQRWGNRAAEMIRKNPYLLMAFRGCGFLRTHDMYVDLGLPPTRLKCQAYAAWHRLATDREGHTWHPISTAVAGIEGRVARSAVNAPAALLLAKRGRMIATRRDEKNRLWVAEAKKAIAEERIAYYVAQAAMETERDSVGLLWPDRDQIDQISDHQGEQFTLATRGRLGLFIGSPGTGKSFTVAAAARCIAAVHGLRSIAVAAPTGKAAVRVTEIMQSYGLQLQATTIHRLLGVESRDKADGGFGFRFGEHEPLPYKFIIVDEESMVDVSLQASLFAARNRGAHMLLVGDPNQLAPVGHGAPLRDMITAGVPCGELREIRRNSGRIVTACAEIRDGQAFSTSPAIDLEAGENLKHVEAANPAQQIAKMFQAIEAARLSDLNPVWDCQVLVPVNAKSELSRRELNSVLQQNLNKSGQKAGNNPFMVGDKIVNTKNGLFPVYDDDWDLVTDPSAIDKERRVFVANGELGEVIAVSEKLTVARLVGPDRYIKILRSTAKVKAEKQEGEGEGEEESPTGCDWDLGYALSVHKSQGSEWPVVIVMLDEYMGARKVCSREWLYTAISRARRLCLLVGKKSTADSMCKRQALHRRKTFLAELIREKMAEAQKFSKERSRPALTEQTHEVECVSTTA